MSKRKRSDPPAPASTALELFQPDPDALYSLDAAARLAGVPRRALLIYCREGLVQAVFRSPQSAMEFTEEAIHTVRRIEHLRAVHGLDMAWLKTLFELLNEVERLRAEVRFLRGQ